MVWTFFVEQVSLGARSVSASTYKKTPTEVSVLSIYFDTLEIEANVDGGVVEVEAELAVLYVFDGSFLRVFHARV